MQHIVEELLAEDTVLTASEVARRAGINRSTLHRIAVGQVQPSLSTLREIAIVKGLDLEVSLRPLSDPDAASAARHLLDSTSADLPLSSGEREWVERLQRVDPSGNDPYLTLATAARASSLLHRSGAHLFRGAADPGRLASAGDAAGDDWAISGRAAIEFGRREIVRGPSILWTADADGAARALTGTHKRAESPLNAHVMVVPAHPGVFVDTFTVDQIRFVAPIQMLLDCIGLGGELETQASMIANGWSS